MQTHGAMTQPVETLRPAAELLAELHQVRHAVAAEGRTLWQRWDIGHGRRRFRVSALNFAQYLALRRRDLRALQTDLMPYGLSSLGRSEGRVLANLDAVIGALSALAGGPHKHYPRPHAFFRGERLLRANMEELFGPVAQGTRTARIMVTLPTEAADDPALLATLLRNGTNVVRINCAHDGPSVWAAMIANLRAAEKATGCRARILADLGGPKVRTGQVQGAGHQGRIHEGDQILLTAGGFADPTDHPWQAECEPASIVQRLAVGDPVFIDDGKLAARVERCAHEGVIIQATHTGPKGFKLKPQKGLNFPSTDLGLLALTDQDHRSLDFIAREVDMIGYSFVHSAADVRLLQQELAARRPQDWQRIGLIAKIETQRAVHNLPEIIVQAASNQPFGVMIARGDLAVEIGFERLAEMQEELLWLCEAAHVPVIWATQVLESLVKKGLPTRGDMTDAAMSARAECVMLNKGPYVAEAVAALDRLLTRMAENQSKKTPKLRALRSWDTSVGPAAGAGDSAGAHA